MPNNLNIHSYRSFSRYGITIAFFAIQLSKLALVKTLLLLDCIENLCYEEIVWRQLELAFFGAVTLVAALFVFQKKRMETERCNCCGQEYDKDLMQASDNCLACPNCVTEEKKIRRKK